jgi:putative aldouronate transport system permease protein
MLTLGYDKIILLYNPSIYETADVISTYVYRRGLLNADYSYSAAVGMFNSVFNFIFLMTANTFSKKATGSGLW